MNCNNMEVELVNGDAVNVQKEKEIRDRSEYIEIKSEGCSALQIPEDNLIKENVDENGNIDTSTPVYFEDNVKFSCERINIYGEEETHHVAKKPRLYENKVNEVVTQQNINCDNISNYKETTDGNPFFPFKTDIVQKEICEDTKNNFDKISCSYNLNIFLKETIRDLEKRSKAQFITENIEYKSPNSGFAFTFKNDDTLEPSPNNNLTDENEINVSLHKEKLTERDKCCNDIKNENIENSCNTQDLQHPVLNNSNNEIEIASKHQEHDRPKNEAIPYYEKSVLIDTPTVVYFEDKNKFSPDSTNIYEEEETHHVAQKPRLGENKENEVVTRQNINFDNISNYKETTDRNSIFPFKVDIFQREICEDTKDNFDKISCSYNLNIFLKETIRNLEKRSKAQFITENIEYKSPNSDFAFIFKNDDILEHSPNNKLTDENEMNVLLHKEKLAERDKCCNDIKNENIENSCNTRDLQHPVLNNCNNEIEIASKHQEHDRPKNEAIPVYEKSVPIDTSTVVYFEDKNTFSPGSTNIYEKEETHHVAKKPSLDENKENEVITPQNINFDNISNYKETTDRNSIFPFKVDIFQGEICEDTKDNFDKISCSYNLNIFLKETIRNLEKRSKAQFITENIEYKSSNSDFAFTFKNDDTLEPSSNNNLTDENEINVLVHREKLPEPDKCCNDIKNENIENSCNTQDLQHPVLNNSNNEIEIASKHQEHDRPKNEAIPDYEKSVPIDTSTLVYFEDKNKFSPGSTNIYEEEETHHVAKKPRLDENKENEVVTQQNINFDNISNYKETTDGNSIFPFKVDIFQREICEDTKDNFDKISCSYNLNIFLKETIRNLEKRSKAQFITENIEYKSPNSDFAFIFKNDDILEHSPNNKLTDENEMNVLLHKEKLAERDKCCNDIKNENIENSCNTRDLQHPVLNNCNNEIEIASKHQEHDRPKNEAIPVYEKSVPIDTSTVVYFEDKNTFSPGSTNIYEEEETHHVAKKPSLDENKENEVITPQNINFDNISNYKETTDRNSIFPFKVDIFQREICEDTKDNFDKISCSYNLNIFLKETMRDLEQRSKAQFITENIEYKSPNSGFAFTFKNDDTLEPSANNNLTDENEIDFLLHKEKLPEPDKCCNDIKNENIENSCNTQDLQHPVLNNSNNEIEIASKHQEHDRPKNEAIPDYEKSVPIDTSTVVYFEDKNKFSPDSTNIYEKEETHHVAKKPRLDENKENEVITQQNINFDNISNYKETTDRNSIFPFKVDIFQGEICEDTKDNFDKISCSYNLNIFLKETIRNLEKRSKAQFITENIEYKSSNSDFAFTFKNDDTLEPSSNNNLTDENEINVLVHREKLPEPDKCCNDIKNENIENSCNTQDLQHPVLNNSNNEIEIASKHQEHDRPKNEAIPDYEKSVPIDTSTVVYFEDKNTFSPGSTNIYEKEETHHVAKKPSLDENKENEVITPQNINFDNISNYKETTDGNSIFPFKVDIVQKEIYEEKNNFDKISCSYNLNIFLKETIRDLEKRSKAQFITENIEYKSRNSCFAFTFKNDDTLEPCPNNNLTDENEINGLLHTEKLTCSDIKNENIENSLNTQDLQHPVLNNSNNEIEIASKHQEHDRPQKKTILDYEKSIPNDNIIRQALQDSFALAWNKKIQTPFTLSVVDKNSAEYRKVKRLFKSTSRGLIIKKLERVENPFILAQYLLKKEQKLKSKGKLMERNLFHGTRETNIDAICKSNFDWRLCGSSRGCKFGQGVSFAPEASYAQHYSHGDGVMILAKVLVHKSVVGDCNTVVPPEPYDTTTNSQRTVFVKYEDNEFYPKYVIHYSY